jgi:hypothetical protein
MTRAGDKVVVYPYAPTRLFGQKVTVREVLGDAPVYEVIGMVGGQTYVDHLRAEWFYSADGDHPHRICYACTARVDNDSVGFWEEPQNARAMLNDMLHHIVYGKGAFQVGDFRLLEIAIEAYDKANAINA